MLAAADRARHEMQTDCHAILVHRSLAEGIDAPVRRQADKMREADTIAAELRSAHSSTVSFDDAASAVDALWLDGVS